MIFQIAKRGIRFFLLVLLIGCTGKSTRPLDPIAPMPLTADALPVVIDTDMAADDWLAILYLLMRSDVEVIAITVTGAGEALLTSFETAGQEIARLGTEMGETVGGELVDRLDGPGRANDEHLN